MDRLASARRRGRLALLACLLWLAGVEVLPNLHEALHARLAPHRHDGGLIITVREAPEQIAARRAREVSPEPRASTRRGLPSHAAGLAHHALALMPAAPPLLVPLPVDRRPWLVALVTPVARAGIEIPAASARGPPRAESPEGLSSWTSERSPRAAWISLRGPLRGRFAFSA